MRNRTWMGWTVALVAGALLLGLQLGRSQAATPEEQRTLRGLSGVCVLVEDLGPFVEEKSGITTAQMEAEVVGTLQANGIRVLTPAEAILTPGAPALSVRVDFDGASLLRTVKTYWVSMELQQECILSRDRKTEELCTTWELSGFHIGSRPETYTRVMRSVIGSFVADYLNANRKPVPRDLPREPSMKRKRIAA